MPLLALLLVTASLVERVDVDVSGVKHTRASAVRRLMTTRTGVLLDQTTLHRDLARLRSTGILYDVEEHTVSAPRGRAWSFPSRIAGRCFRCSDCGAAADERPRASASRTTTHSDS